MLPGDADLGGPATKAMNFYAHAVLAESERSDAGFVLGAMLPDLAAMAGLRIASTDHPALRDGMRLHHASDHAFHAAPLFRQLVAEGVRELQADGLRRGPARAAAHVGLELLLDGWLVAVRPPTRVYEEALGSAADRGAAIRWRAQRPGAWTRLCRRLTAPGVVDGYADPREVARRTVRVLHRRPRLALTPDEHAPLASWLAVARARVAHHGPALLRAARPDARGDSRRSSLHFAPSARRG